MATNIFDYAQNSPSPSSSPTPNTTPIPTNMTSPPSSPSPYNGATGGLWGGHVKPAEVQIIVIVLIAGLFNAFFLTLSLRLLWRRYHHGPFNQNMPAAPTSTVPPDIEANIRRVTPMLVRQPDDELVYGLKQVLEDDPKSKEPIVRDGVRT